MEAPHGPRTFSRGGAPSGGAFLGDRLTLSPTRVWNKLPLPVFLLSAVCPAHSSAQTRGAFSAGERQPGALYPEHVMRRAGAEFPRLAPEELARLAGEVADQYVAENMPAAGGFCLSGGTAEARRNAFVGISSGGAGPKPVPPGRLGAGDRNRGGAVPPLTLRTPDGRTVQVQGKIDRGRNGAGGQDLSARGGLQNGKQSI